MQTCSSKFSHANQALENDRYVDHAYAEHTCKRGTRSEILTDMLVVLCLIHFDEKRYIFELLKWYCVAVTEKWYLSVCHDGSGSNNILRPTNPPPPPLVLIWSRPSILYRVRSFSSKKNYLHLCKVMGKSYNVHETSKQIILTFSLPNLATGDSNSPTWSM